MRETIAKKRVRKHIHIIKSEGFKAWINHVQIKKCKLAKILNVKPCVISHWIHRGDKPSASGLLKIEMALLKGKINTELCVRHHLSQ